MQKTIILLLSVVFVVMACNNSVSKNKEDQSTATKMIDQQKKTQALLLTQNFPYDSTDKNKISGNYVTQTKITVPQNLATQSKWIMFEGPLLENDLVAYRYYADSRHRFDIYGKTVTDLVMDTVSWQYHDIMNWGSDVLKVGNSLGLGSPAIWYKDSLYTLSNAKNKTIEILENGDEQAKIRTTFTGLQIADQEFDLIQDWRIVAGQAWSEIELRVINGMLPEGMYFATGIVKHLPTIETGETSSHFYAMNWGEQSFHEENMGMAITADKKYQAKLVDDELSYAYAFSLVDQQVKYRFLAAWERDNNKVRNETDFRILVENAAR